MTVLNRAAHSLSNGIFKVAHLCFRDELIFCHFLADISLLLFYVPEAFLTISWPGFVLRHEERHAIENVADQVHVLENVLFLHFL